MNEERSISVFVPSLAGGGAEKMMVDLANEFASRGYDVDLVLAAAEGPFMDRVTPSVEIIDLDAPEPPGYGLLGAVPGLVNYLRRKRPTGMLSALNRANAIAIIAATIAQTETEVVVSERNHLSRYLEHASQKERVVLPRLIRATYPKADSIISISNGVATDLADTTGIERESIDVIHNPAFSPDIQAKSKESVSHPWFDTDIPVIIAVGSLTQQKDFCTLLRAFSILRERQDAHLLILGEGELREELESLANELEIATAVDMPGFVDNPYAYMRQADVFVLSSKWEGFGNVVVEALACGCPVVSTDCPSGPAEILANGEYGSLTPVGDETALAAEIETVLNTTPEPDRLRARADEFTTETVADQYMSHLLN